VFRQTVNLALPIQIMYQSYSRWFRDRQECRLPALHQGYICDIGADPFRSHFSGGIDKQHFAIDVGEGGNLRRCASQ
jgi:hypothetical protein